MADDIYAQEFFASFVCHGRFSLFSFAATGVLNTKPIDRQQLRKYTNSRECTRILRKGTYVFWFSLQIRIRIGKDWSKTCPFFSRIRLRFRSRRTQTRRVSCAREEGGWFIIGKVRAAGVLLTKYIIHILYFLLRHQPSMLNVLKITSPCPVIK